MLRKTALLNNLFSGHAFYNIGDVSAPERQCTDNSSQMLPELELLEKSIDLSRLVSITTAYLPCAMVLMVFERTQMKSRAERAHSQVLSSPLRILGLRVLDVHGHKSVEPAILGTQVHGHRCTPRQSMGRSAIKNFFEPNTCRHLNELREESPGNVSVAVNPESQESPGQPTTQESHTEPAAAAEEMI
ncbi:hypothetical protein EV1_015378 [Malus domestica]